MAVSGRHFLTFGILNITPDSFSDGGIYAEPEDAIRRAQELLETGSDFVDVGAESTRPGSKSVTEQDEWGRLEPFLFLAATRGLIQKISLDTRKFPIMKRAVEMGVAFINCVGPVPDEPELSVLTSINSELGFIATHVHGTPETMQLSPLGPRSAKKRVFSFFENCQHELLTAGFLANKIFLDPGIGFGKSDAANLGVLAEVPGLADTYNVAIGVSRKGFIGRLFGSESPQQRDPLSKALETCAVLAGAKLIRTHDVLGLSRIRPDIEEALT